MPRFRLDHGLVLRRLESLKTLGVEFVYDTRIGDGAGVDALFSSGFEAVFLGTGAGLPTRPDIPGADLQGVYPATPFLVRANVEQNFRPSELEDPPAVGQRVAVLGGGDTAMDCCRTALRLGASEVSCYYRRTEKEMPGNARDRAFAREEGTSFRWLVSPVRILGDREGRVRGVEFVKVTLGDPDAIGRPRPVSLPGSEFQLPADTVVLALGYGPDPSLPEETKGLAAVSGGLLLADPETGRTSREMVWAGGDNVLGPSLVAHAVAQGRVAARDIHARLSWSAGEGGGQEQRAPVE
jgi:glutamate synthase (NADPH/NADH) small chain